MPERNGRHLWYIAWLFLEEIRRNRSERRDFIRMILHAATETTNVRSAQLSSSFFSVCLPLSHNRLIAVFHLHCEYSNATYLWCLQWVFSLHLLIILWCGHKTISCSSNLYIPTRCWSSFSTFSNSRELWASIRRTVFCILCVRRVHACFCHLQRSKCSIGEWIFAKCT